MDNKTCRYLIKSWLAGFLFFLPFQRKITDSLMPFNDVISSLVANLDELTIVFFFPIAIWKLSKDKVIMERAYTFFLFSILSFIIIGMISVRVNGNSFIVSALGIFDYIKNFLVIFIYAAFFRDLNELKKIFTFLLVIAVAIGSISLIQELWALASRYIVGKGITDKSIYIFTELYNSSKELSLNDFNAIWRYGIYKALFMFINSNILGMYFLWFFTLYLFMNKKKNIIVFIPLMSGIVVSVSRMVYVAFAIIIGNYIFKGKKWFIASIIPLIICITFLSFIVADRDSDMINASEHEPDFDATDSIHTTQLEMAMSDATFRSYSRTKAVEIWKDNVFWGIGPGMFGGTISMKYNSPVYSEYNFSGGWRKFMAKIGSIDQFWPQVLAEMGVIGLIGFIGLFGTFLSSLYVISSKIGHVEIKDLFSGLVTFAFVILIYLLGSGLNVTLIVFTYLAFVGMGLGCAEKFTKVKMSNA